MLLIQVGGCVEKRRLTGMDVDQITLGDAALRALSFSPWGAVVLGVALSIRKAILAMALKWDELLILLQTNADALKQLSQAQEAAAVAQREATLLLHAEHKHHPTAVR